MSSILVAGVSRNDIKPTQIVAALAAPLHKSTDNRSNLEMHHEGSCRSSRVGRADCHADVHSVRERGSDVAGELLFRLEWLLTMIPIRTRGL